MQLTTMKHSINEYYHTHVIHIHCSILIVQFKTYNTSSVPQECQTPSHVGFILIWSCITMYNPTSARFPLEEPSFHFVSNPLDVVDWTSGIFILHAWHLLFRVSSFWSCFFVGSGKITYSNKITQTWPAKDYYFYFYYLVLLLLLLLLLLLSSTCSSS